MTTPVLERLHQLYPSASIDLLCDTRSNAVFEHCPYRGEVFLKERKMSNSRMFKLIRVIRKKRYDLIVDLRSDILAYLLRAKQRLTKFGHKPYGPHAVEDLISIIDKINPDKVIPPVKTWIDEMHQKEADKLMTDVKGNRWLAIAPGANWKPKIWDPEKYAATANTLGDMIDSVILLGGPKDTEYSSIVAKNLEIPFLDMTNKTDLLTSCAIIQKCLLFIGNDSGLGHLASAVNTPSISIFGPGHPERYHPWHENAKVIQGENQQFTGISINEVVRQADALLAG